MASSEVFNLPFPRLSNKELNADLLVLLDRNLLEIERQLSILQLYENETGKPTNEAVDNVLDDAGKVKTGELSDTMVGLLSTLQLADAAVTEAKIAVAAVTQVKIADEAVDEAKIATAAITAVKLAQNAVTSEKIALGAITNEKIGLGTITNDKIQAGSIKEASMNWSLHLLF